MTRQTFDQWALGIAEQTAQRSKDPSTKCGAVIFREDKSVCSVGYNGFPRAMEDKDEWYADRTEKYDRVIHAEMNALLAANESLKGMTLYVSGPTCKDCAKHVIASGITTVCWPAAADKLFRERWGSSIDRAMELYKDCNINVKIVE